MQWSLFARAVATALVLGALAAGPASAQITTGTVAGSVKDDQGLAVPGASVMLVSEARGTRMAPVVTSATGDFVVPNVTPDTYTIEVIDAGVSSRLRRPGVAVSGGDRVSVGDLTARGRRDDRDHHRHVRSAADPVAERRAIVPRHHRRSREPPDRHRPQLRVADLADPGRRWARRPRLGGGGQNNIMMDGVSTMDTGNNGQLLQMNPEAIAEVKVLTAGYQAEYGRSSGLQITAVTKSGTNRFRGPSTTSCATPTGTRTAG